MDGPLDKAGEHHGLGDPGPIRYAALCLGLAAWIVLGAWLLGGSAWPSTCTPGNLVEVYACSARLPESGRWQEAALLTWLWASPILLALHLMRRLGPRSG